MSELEESKVGVLLIAHGSRNPQANDDLFSLVERFRTRGFPISEASFLELAKPDILDGGKKCVEKGAALVIMLPYFLSAGIHVVEDLIESKMQLEAFYPSIDFYLAKPLGPHPLLETILEQRLREEMLNHLSLMVSDKSKMVSSSRIV